MFKTLNDLCPSSLPGPVSLYRLTPEHSFKSSGAGLLTFPTVTTKTFNEVRFLGVWSWPGADSWRIRKILSLEVLKEIENCF